MKLYLMQHGKPFPKEKDPEKPLSPEGKRDVERMSKYLQNFSIEMGAIWHSGKIRARETAQIMASNLNPKGGIIEKENLSPLDKVKPMAQEIIKREKSLLIVGHLPHLSNLASYLVFGNVSSPVVRFQQGAVLCLEKEAGGNWIIVWMLIPEMI